MCSFITILSRMECQASRISLCRHTDDLSTISTLSKSTWWLWSLWCLANKEISSNVALAFACSFTRVLALAMSDQCKHSLYIWSWTQFLWKFSILSFGFFKSVRDGANMLMDNLDVETSENICDSLGESFGEVQDTTKPCWLVLFISCCLFSWWSLWMKLAGKVLVIWNQKYLISKLNC